LIRQKPKLPEKKGKLHQKKGKKKPFLPKKFFLSFSLFIFSLFLSFFR